MTVTDKNGDPIATGTSDGNGNITIPVDSSDVTPGEDLTVTPKGGNPTTVTVPTDTTTTTPATTVPTISNPKVTPNGTDYTVTGTTTPNTVVTLTNDKGYVIGAGTSNAKGDFSIPVSGTKVTGGDTITITPEKGISNTAVVPDATKPSITDPAITPDGKGGYTVTGTTTPNTPVTVTDDKGNPIASGTSDGKGNVNIPVDGTDVKPGESVTVTPEGGNPSTVTVPVVTPTISNPAVTGNPTDGYHVTGTTTPNTPVTVTDDKGNPVGNTTSDGNGNFDIPVAGTDLTPGETVKITPANGESNTAVVPDDTKATITDPKITPTNDGNYTVTGKTEPNTPVTVTDDNGDPIATGTSDGKGNFTIPVDGSDVTPGEDLTVTPKDGNPSTVTVPTTTTTTTPTTAAPTISNPAVATDGDNYKVTGTTTPNTPVTVTNGNGDVLGTGKSDGNGDFSIPVDGSAVTPGETVTITPDNGVSNTAVVPDDSKPSVTDTTVTPNDKGGYDVTGKTDPNTPVTVTDDKGNPVATGTSDGNGDFTIPVDGNTVKPGEDLTVTPKDGNPTTVTVPETTPTISNPAVTGDSTDGYHVTGTTTPNTPVTITDDQGNPIATGTSDGNGNFDIPVAGTDLTPGETVKITPENGKSNTAVVPDDNKATITDPKITPTDDGNYTVTGKTTPNTPVTITDENGDPIAKGTSDGSGNFTIPVDGTEVKPGEDLTVTPKDGNPSTVTVPAKTSPTISNPNVATNGDNYNVTGTTTPNTHVTVTDPNGKVLGTGTSDKNGDFTIPVDGDNVIPGETVTITPENGVSNTAVVPNATKPSVTDPTIIPDGNGGYDVTGKTTPNTPVTVTDEKGNPIATDTSDGNGDFTIPVDGTKVTPGEDLTVTPKDGNPSTVTVPTIPSTISNPAVTGDPTTGYNVTGTTTPNTPVTVKDDKGNPIANGTSDGNGNFDIPVDGSKLTPGQTVTITPKDGTPNTAVVPDSTKPSVTNPTITPTDDGYNVTGKTDPNTPVTITDEKGNPVATGTSDDNGNFTIPVKGTDVTPGEDLTVTPKDGNPSTVTVPTATTTPATPTISDPAVIGNATDGYKVTGKTTPNTVVSVTDDNGNLVASGTSDGNGDFTINAGKDLTPGSTVTITPDGGISNTAVVPDSTKPSVTDPTVTPNDKGGYDVTGKTEPNTPVTVTDEKGNPIAKGTSDGNGNFTIPVDGNEVKPGEDLTVTPKDGNPTTVTVPTDTTTPTTATPTISDPTITPDGDDYKVTGKTTPNTPVTLTNDDGKVLGKTTSDGNGDFTIPVTGSEVTPGDTLTVTPDNGISNTVVVPDVTKPSVTDTDVTPNNNGGYDVTGKTDPNTPVTITDDKGNPIATGTSDGNGNFTIPVDDAM
ncbi:Ig-like domain-containing protein [Secundilactobacillus odoratitofui]|uniref:Ig-like domain-containing protein n=1 Tax=Secundilactobacillus odoratitofui TaxID=480930 RepID=UPI0006D1E873|nr:Ig-like domain-containing protein [Secundilactobacillus odoratitofui]